MRIVPSHWRLDTWWCAMHGHVTPAGQSQGFPAQWELAVALPDGTQLARCLRCDTWIHTEVPASTDLPGQLPRPLRGKALEELLVLRAIAVERGVHVIFFVLLAVGLVALQLGLPALQQQAGQLLALVEQTRSGHQAFAQWLTDIVTLTSGRLWVLAAAAGGYAALEAVEAVFLWKGRRWAEYLTVVGIAVFLPLTINELVQKVTMLRVAGVVVDLAILIYLIWTKRLFGVRGGQAGLDAELAADVDWDAIHVRAPVMPEASPSGRRTPRR